MTQNPAFRLIRPETRISSVVFASPHSGRAYDPAFLRASVLDERLIRSSEDAFTDLLYAAAPALGAPLLHALAPRSFVDMNRSPEELDPALIDGAARVAHNPRISSGLGVVPRVVAGGRAIYHGKMPLAEAQARIAQFWRPYHAALQGLLDESMAMFGEAILIDCHSMPHEAIESYGQPGLPRPQVILGDRFGASAGARVTDRVETAFARAGLRVARNAPFAGAFVAQHYGRPSRGQHVVQIEIDRALYMNEEKVCPGDGFEAFRDLLTGVIAQVIDCGRRRVPLAAE